MAHGLLVAVFGVSSVFTGFCALLACYLASRLSLLAWSACRFSLEIPEPASSTSASNSSDKRFFRTRTLSLGRKHSSSHFRSGSSMSSMNNNSRKKGGVWSKLASAMCTWLFTMFLFIRTGITSKMFHQMLHSKHGAHEKLNAIRKQYYYRVGTSITLWLLWIGYGFMSIITFERLSSVFSDSSYKLSDCCIRTFRVIIATATMSALFAFAAYYWFSDGIPIAALLFPSFVIYPVTLVYSSYRFFSITRQMSSNMSPDISALQMSEQQSGSQTSLVSVNQGRMKETGHSTKSNSMVLSTVSLSMKSKHGSHSHSQSNQIKLKRKDSGMNPNESVRWKIRELMNGSLRLSVLSFSVILSSSLMLLITVLVGITDEPALLMMQHVISASDMVCNVFCLFCVFREHEGMYLRVFSIVHQYWLDRLVPI